MRVTPLARRASSVARERVFAREPSVFIGFKRKWLTRGRNEYFKKAWTLSEAL